MDQQVGLLQFLERRLEGLQQGVRQVADETDRIGDNDFRILWKTQSGAFGVECAKSLSSARTELLVSVLSSVDFPALV